MNMSETSSTRASDEVLRTPVQPQGDRSLEGSSSESGPAAGRQGRAGAEERQQMIAIVAYYRAERRGFEPGGELDDWLAAEAEIEQPARTQGG